MGQDNVFDIPEPYSAYRYYLPSTRSEFSIEEPSYAHRPAYKEDESRSSGLVSGDSFRRGSTCRVLLCVFLVFSFIAVVVAAITLAVLLSETYRFPRSTTIEKYESNASLLGRDFNQNFLNKSSDDFKKLEEEFCTAIQQIFTTTDSPVLTEFADCEVMEFLNGSVFVRYRIGVRQKVPEKVKTDEKIEEKLRAHFKNKVIEHGSWTSVKLHPQFIEKFIKVESKTTAVPIITSEQRHTMSTQVSSVTTFFMNISLESRQSTPEYLSTFEQKKIASTTDKEIHPTAFISVTEDRITTIGRMPTTDKALTRTGRNFTSKPVLEKINETLRDVSFEGQSVSSTEFQLSNELVTAGSREITSAKTDSFATNATSLNYIKTATQRSMTRTDAITANTSSFQPVIGVHKTTESPILLRTETEHIFIEDEKTTQLILENTSKSILEVSSEVRTTEQELVQKFTTAWQPTKTSKDIALADVITTEVENVTVSDKTGKTITTERQTIDSSPSSTYAYLHSSNKSFMSTSSIVKNLTEPGKVVLTSSTVEQRTTTAPMTSTSDTWYESTDFMETAHESTTWMEEDTTPQSTKHMPDFAKHVSLTVETKPPITVKSPGPSITILPTMPASSTHLIVEPKFKITADIETEFNTTEIYSTFATLPRTPDSITKIIGQTTPDDVVNTIIPHDIVNKITSSEVVNKTTHVKATASTMPRQSKFIISEEPVEGFTSQFHPLPDGINVTSVDMKKTVDVTEGNLVPRQTTHISFTSSVSSAISLTQVQTTTPQIAPGSHQIGKFVTDRMPSFAEITRSAVETNITDLPAQRFVTNEDNQTTIHTTTTKSREFKTTPEPVTQTTESYERTSIYTAPSLQNYQTITDATRNKLRETVKTAETVGPTREPSERNSTDKTPSSLEIFKLTVKEGGTLEVNISFASPFTFTQIPVLNDTSKALESFIKLDAPKPSTKLTGGMIAETTLRTLLQKSESTVSTPFENTLSPIVHGVVADRSPNGVVTHSKGNVSVSDFSEVALILNDTGGPITHNVADYYDYDVTNESLTNDTLLDLNNFPVLNESNTTATEAIEPLTKAIEAIEPLTKAIEAIEPLTKAIFTKHETTNSANLLTVYPHINISDVTSSRRSQGPMHTGDRDTNVLARVITMEPAKLESMNEFARATTYIPTEVQASMEQTVLNVSRADIRRVLGMTTQTRINVTDLAFLLTSTTYKPIHSPARSFQATVTAPSMEAAFGLMNITKAFSENIIPNATSEQVSNGDTVYSVTLELPNKLISSLIPTEFPDIHNTIGDPTLFTELAGKSVNTTAAAFTDSNIAENIGVSAESPTFHDIIGIDHDSVSRKTIRIKETTMHANSPNLTMSATLPATLDMHSSVTEKKDESSISSGDAHDRFYFNEISTNSHLVDNVSSIAILSTPAIKDNATEHLEEAIAELKQVGKHFIETGSLGVSDNVDVQRVTNMENVSNITSSKTTKSTTEYTEKYISKYVTVTLSVNASLNDSTFITKAALFKNTTANETIVVTPQFVNNVTTFVDDSAIEQHTTVNTFSRKFHTKKNVSAISQKTSSERVLRNSSIADGTTPISLLSTTSDKENATKSLSDVMTRSKSKVAEQDAEARTTSADNTTIISVLRNSSIADGTTPISLLSTTTDKENATKSLSDVMTRSKSTVAEQDAEARTTSADNTTIISVLRNSSIADGTTPIRVLSTTSDKENATKSLSDVMTRSKSTVAEQDAEARTMSADNTTIISVLRNSNIADGTTPISLLSTTTDKENATKSLSDVMTRSKSTVAEQDAEARTTSADNTTIISVLRNSSIADGTTPISLLSTTTDKENATKSLSDVMTRSKSTVAEQDAEARTTSADNTTIISVLRNSSIADGTTPIRVLSTTSDKENATKSLSDVMTRSKSTVAEQDAEARTMSADNTTIISVLRNSNIADGTTPISLLSTTTDKENATKSLSDVMTRSKSTVAEQDAEARTTSADNTTIISVLRNSSIADGTTPISLLSTTTDKENATKSLSDVMTRSKSTVAEQDAEARTMSADSTTIISVLRNSNIADGTTLISLLSTTTDKENATKSLSDVMTRSKSTVAEQDAEARTTSADNTTIISVLRNSSIADGTTPISLLSTTTYKENATKSLSDVMTRSKSTVAEQDAEARTTSADNTTIISVQNDTAITRTTSADNTTIISVLRNSSIADGTTLISLLSTTTDKENATKSLSDVMTRSKSTVAEQDAEARTTSADNTTIISVQNDTAITSTETILEETRRAITDIDHDTFSLVNVSHSAEKKGRNFTSEDFALGNATFNASTFNILPDAVTMHERVGYSSKKDDNARTKSMTFTASPTTIVGHDERFLMDYNLASYDSRETTTSLNTLMNSFFEGHITSLPVQGIGELVSTDENLGDNATSVKATAIQNETEISSNKTLRISADTVRTSSISGAKTTSTDANSNITLSNFFTNETETSQATITLHFMRTIPLRVGNDNKKTSEAENSEQSTTFYKKLFTRMPIVNGTARSQTHVSSVDELLSSETKSTLLSTPAVSVDETTTDFGISYSTITSTDVDSSESNVLLATKEIPNDTTISSIGSDFFTTIDTSIEFGTEISSKMFTLSNINSTSIYIENISPSNKTSLLTNFSAVIQKAESDSHIDHAFIDITTINATIPHYSNMSLSNELFNDMSKTSLNETQRIFNAFNVFGSTKPYKKETEGHIAKGLNATMTTVHSAEMMDKTPTVEDTINAKDEILIESNIKSLVKDVTQSMNQSVQTTAKAIINKEASKSIAKAFAEAKQTSKFTDVTRATTLPSQTASRAFTSEISTPTTQTTQAVLKIHTFTTKGTPMHTEDTTSYYYEDMNTTDYYYENYTEFEVFQTHTDSPINVDVNNTKLRNESDIGNKTRHEKSVIGNANKVITSATTSVTESRDSIVSKVTEIDIKGSITKLVAVAAANNSKEASASIVHTKLPSESAFNNTKLISNSSGSHPVSESPTSVSKTVALSPTNSINPHTVLPANTVLPFAPSIVKTSQRPLLPL